MRPVRINKANLLTKLQENRDHHHDLFLEAVEGYRKKAIELLEQHISDVKSGRVFQVYVHLPKPEDHTKDYDAVISMLGMSEDDIIDVDEKTYREMVLDEWDWKQAWGGSNSMYSAATAREMQKEEYY